MIGGNQERIGMKTIRELRVKKGITQFELAKEIDVTTATVYNWERRVHEPKASQLKALANFFGVSMDAIDFAPSELKQQGKVSAAAGM
jgi:transcriptional regulator with XRE-family HTH domain